MLYDTSLREIKFTFDILSLSNLNSTNSRTVKLKKDVHMNFSKTNLLIFENTHNSKSFAHFRTFSSNSFLA